MSLSTKSWMGLAVLGLGACAVGEGENEGTGARARLLAEEGTTIHWSQYRRSPRKTAYNALETALTSDTILDVELFWSEFTGTDTSATPAADQSVFHSDRFYVATGNPDGVAFDGMSGGVFWEGNISSLPGVRPAYLNSTVFVRTAEAIRGLRANTGSLRTTIREDSTSQFLSATLARDFGSPEYLYTVSQDTTTGAIELAAWDAEGDVLGEVMTPVFTASLGTAATPSTKAFSDPAFAEIGGEGRVFVVVNGALVARDALTGAAVWQKPLDGGARAFVGIPAVRFGRVYVAYGEKLFAVDADTGSESWSVDESESPVGQLVVTDDGVLMTTESTGTTTTYVNRYDLEDGTRLARKSLLGLQTPAASLVGAADLVYVSLWYRGDAYLCILEIETLEFVTRGSAVSEIQLSKVDSDAEGPYGEPIVTAGRIFVTTTDTALAFGIMDPPAPIRPVLECVEDNGDGTITAKFGYLNENDRDTTVATGSDNRLTPSVTGATLPTVFRPGRQRFVFEITVDEDAVVVWTLGSPDGSRRTSTASASGPKC